MASTAAFRNQRNSSNGRKSSRPSTRSQNPCEMFVTSAAEVTGPGIPDLLLAFFDRPSEAGQILVGEAAVAGQTRSSARARLSLRRLLIGRGCATALPRARRRSTEMGPRADRGTHASVCFPFPPAFPRADADAWLQSWLQIEMNWADLRAAHRSSHAVTDPRCAGADWLWSRRSRVQVPSLTPQECPAN
jgi:hypothetical protein